MLFNYLHKIGWFVGLVFLQVLVLNHVNVGGYATPFLYVFFILKAETDTSRNMLMLCAFLLGLLIDIFSDTPGMNAAATVWLAFVRPFVMHLFMPRDTNEMPVPSIRTMGVAPFLKYVFFCVLLHHLLLFGIEYFSFAHIETWLLHAGASTLLTTSCVMALEGARKKR